MIGYFLLGRERLRSYSVHEPPQPAADRVTRAEALEFIKDGFVVPAFVLPPLWLAARGIWLGMLAYAAAAATIAVISVWLDLPPLWPAIVLLGVHLLFGLEADELHRSHLAARGWETVGHVTGTGALDCERRFYDHWLPTAPMTRSGGPADDALARFNPKLATAPTAVAGPAMVVSQVPPTQPAGILGNLLAPLRRGKQPRT
jgi:Protein of unknown function (DUF2628)